MKITKKKSALCDKEWKNGALCKEYYIQGENCCKIAIFPKRKFDKIK
ncbi:hypothetical protein ACQCVP_05720 [Rossellomorea vietnamensis]